MIDTDARRECMNTSSGNSCALVGRGRGVATRATLDQHAYPILPPVPLHTNVVFPALPPPFVLSGGNLL